MTEVAATRRYQFKLTSRGNVKRIAEQINNKIYSVLNRNRCEASAFVDPKDPSTIVVEMRCATGADIYSVDRDTILSIIKESEKDKIEHVIGPLELEE